MDTEDACALYETMAGLDLENMNVESASRISRSIT